MRKNYKNFIILLSIFLTLLVNIQIIFADEKIEVGVDGKNLVIRDNDAILNCSAKIKDEIYLLNKTIKIIQTDTSSTHSFCECPMDIIHTIHNLQTGKYKIEVYREELKKFGYPNDKKYLVGTSEIDFQGENTKFSIYYEFKQSSCKSSTKANNQSFQIPKTLKLEAAANTSKNELSVHFYTLKTVDAKFVMYNLIGKEVFSYEKKNIDEGLQSWNFFLPNIPSGIYLCKLILSNGKSETIKLIWSR